MIIIVVSFSYSCNLTPIVSVVLEAALLLLLLLLLLFFCPFILSISFSIRLFIHIYARVNRPTITTLPKWFWVSEFAPLLLILLFFCSLVTFLLHLLRGNPGGFCILYYCIIIIPCTCYNYNHTTTCYCYNLLATLTLHRS